MRLIGAICIIFILATSFYVFVDSPISRVTIFGSVGDIFLNNVDPDTSLDEVPEIETLLFVGDVMLARDVELRMDEYGGFYPYRYLNTLFASSTYQVGNFEGSVPVVHMPTPSMEFKFSVNPDYTEVLKDVGFTHMSLANNHSLDFGVRARENTIDVLGSNDIETFGQSYSISTSSISNIGSNKTNVSVIGIDLTLSTPDHEELVWIFNEAEEKSQFLIVYVHWGVEYEPIHSEKQELYAKKFIELGADLVVGHHPHVIQDIQIYEGVPVFYSLGNFIFDQYFSVEVQTGLALSIIAEDKLNISLVPVTTIGSKNTPRITDGHERDLLLLDLAVKSDKSLFEMIKSGVISFPQVAVSPQID